MSKVFFQLTCIAQKQNKNIFAQVPYCFKKCGKLLIPIRAVCLEVIGSKSLP